MAEDIFVHDDRFEQLDHLTDWKLEHESQDIRGRPLVMPNGERIGVIDHLLVDTGAKRVAAVRLEDDRCCAVERLEIADDRVIYHPGSATVPASRYDEESWRYQM
ncbi:PRC-barrel domain-containing protein [Novosphingopyxis sp.]|uniref:PRC-barrel domain-containing protein n=1 Tax=Novosphingopyxis sp. TaxID=2709690 RepID=UPI003B5965E2